MTPASLGFMGARERLRGLPVPTVSGGPETAEVLAGTLYYRWLLTPRPIDEHVVDGLIDLFLAAYGVPDP